MLDIKVYGDKCEVVGTKTGKTFFEGDLKDCKKYIQNIRNKYRRRAKDEAMKSLGLVKVKGTLGGTYWE